MQNEINEINETNEIRIQNDAERAENGIMSYSETTAYQETSRPNEIRQEREFPANQPETPRKKKQTAGWYRIFLSTVVVAAVVTLELVGFSNWTGATVKEHFFHVTETSIFYEFILDGFGEGDQAVVEVYNDFQRYRQPAEDPFVSGEVYDLKPNMTYVVELLIDGRSVFREKVRTTAEPAYDPEETIEPWTEPVTEPTTEPIDEPGTDPNEGSETEPTETTEQDPTQAPDGSGGNGDGGINVGDDGGGTGNGNGENDTGNDSGNNQDPTTGP